MACSLKHENASFAMLCMQLLSTLVIRSNFNDYFTACINPHAFLSNHNLFLK